METSREKQPRAQQRPETPTTVPPTPPSPTLTHLLLEIPMAQQHFPAPLFSRVKPRDLQQQEAAVGPGQSNPSCQGLLSLCALARSSPAPRVCPPVLARVSRKPPVQSRGMSHPAQSHRAPAGAIHLWSTWKEECPSQQRAGQVGEALEGGAALFLGGTSCRKQKMKLSLGSARPPFRQQNTLWFCSITTITGPSGSSLE